MGLDVSVYQHIKKLNVSNDEDADYFEAYVIHDDFKDRIKNLESGELYTGDRLECGVSYPYSAHNRFRESLLRMMVRNDLVGNNGVVWDALTPDIPFYELIWFADNEGVIDWETCDKLYKDFKKFEKTAKVYFVGHHFDVYKEWMESFEYGRKMGAVVFH